MRNVLFELLRRQEHGFIIWIYSELHLFFFNQVHATKVKYSACCKKNIKATSLIGMIFSLN